MLPEWWNIPLLLILAGIVIYTDCRYRLVPNWLTLPMIGAGLIGHLLEGGLTGLLDFGLGLAIGFFPLFVVWLLGGVGAGDVKFLAAIGALSGAEFVFKVALLGSLIGGIFALYRFVYFGRKRIWLRFLLWQAGLRDTSGPILTREQSEFPYAVAFGLAVFYVLIAGVKGWWLG